MPVSSPIRNYRDTSHKPELLVALQPFEALAGFRPVARTIELLRALAVSDLDPFIDLLGGPPGSALADAQSDADGLRALFTTWITAPQPDLDVLVPAVLEGAIQYLSSAAGRIPPRRPRRCSSSANGIPGMPGCWPRCCSTGSAWRREKPSSYRPEICTPTFTGWAWR